MHIFRRRGPFASMIFLGAVNLLWACASAPNKEDQVQTTPPPPNVSSSAEKSTQAVPDDETHRGVRVGNGAPGQEDGSVYEGTVQETMDAAGYTYLRVKLDSGADQWVAVEQSEIVMGSRVRIKVSMRMSNFASKGLGRTFPSIWFGYVQPVEDPLPADDETI